MFLSDSCVIVQPYLDDIFNSGTLCFMPDLDNKAFYDKKETCSPDTRESELFLRLPVHLAEAIDKTSGLARHLQGIDPTTITSREALSTLPILRKTDLMRAQSENPPFGGFANLDDFHGSRLFFSPGPVWEPQSLGADPWGAARALYCTGIRKGDVVHNALSHHMTPGGFILDEGVRALGAITFPAGIGNTQQHVEAIHALQPCAYVGTPDYLKTILDKAEEMKIDVSCIRQALVSGGALFPAMRQEYNSRGIVVLQAYATADLGVIAYESLHNDEVVEGMIINEDLIVEICRPGTGDPVELGEVGEIIVTNFSSHYPLVRFATGDLSAFLPTPSPCGRTNVRIKGWMGRADQRTKVKGMFVDPEQIAQLTKQHSNIRAARLIVERQGSQDSMRLLVVSTEGKKLDTAKIVEDLREITKLTGSVEPVDELPNDGKVISDERDYEEEK